MKTPVFVSVVSAVLIIMTGPITPGFAQGCVVTCGDIDHDGSISIHDLTYLQLYLFPGNPPPPCPEEGAAWDGHELLTFSDEVFLTRWLFSGDFLPECPAPLGPLAPPEDTAFAVVVFEGASGAALEVPAGATSHELLLMYDFESPVEAFLVPLELRVGSDIPTVSVLEWGNGLNPDAGFRFFRDDGNGKAVLAADVIWQGWVSGYDMIARLELEFPAAAETRTISIDWTTMPPVQNNVEVHSRIVLPDGFDPASHRAPLLDTDCCVVRGDMNVNGEVTVSDVTEYVCFLFDGACPVLCDEAADFNDDGALNITDLTGLVDFLFRGGDAPPPCR